MAADVPRRLRPQPVRDNCWLLAAEGSEEAWRSTRGSSPGSCGRCSTRQASARRRAPDARARRPRRGGGRLLGRRCACLVHPEDARCYADPDAWGPRLPEPLEEPAGPPHDRGRRPPELARLTIEIVHTPGHTPGRAASRVEGEASCARAISCSRGRSDASTSRIGPRRRCGEPAAVPRVPRRSADAARARPGDHRGPRADREPVPAGAR